MQDKKILVINPGSASKKYAFYIGDKEILKAHFEIENGGFVASVRMGESEEKFNFSEIQYKKSAEFIVDLLARKKHIYEIGEINIIGFRTVAPGKYFLETKEINSEFMKELEKAEDRAPLHVSSLTQEIKEINNLLPNVLKYGVSDSTFYAKRCVASKYYGIPMSLAEEYEIFRFGYHGISAGSAVKKVQEILGETPEKMIICHLGSGSSIIAVKDGIGFDASMGFTPLEGVPMSTRSGDIDAGALIYLMKKKGQSPDELNVYLNKKCGLLGLSEISDDMREIIKEESEGNEKAKTAIDVFVYKIKKQIGSFISALGGVDALVFAATMGERSSIIRARVCEGLRGIGIKLDKNKNDEMVTKGGVISEGGSPVKIIVAKIDEMREIYEEVVRL